MTSSGCGSLSRRGFLAHGGLVIARVGAGSDVVASQSPGETLRDVASRKGVNVGATFMVDRHRAQAELRTHFNMVTSAGLLNWYEESAPRWALRPTAESFRFANADKASAFADDHEMRHEAHHLVWGWPTKVPDWLTEGGYAPDQLMRIVREHVTTVADHFNGQVAAYSVVNEPFDDDGNYLSEDFWVGNSTWSNGSDPDYIEVALRAARETDPAAKLFINDYANEFLTNYWGNRNLRADAMYSLIARLRDAQVPIDGVGMQMHLDATMMPDEATASWRGEELQANIERFWRDHEVETFITEFDVKVHHLTGDQAHQQEIQSTIYRYMVRAALASGGCRNISFFGVADAVHIDNWSAEDWSGGEASDPVLLDDAYEPKPAYQAVLEELQALPDAPS